MKWRILGVLAVAHIFSSCSPTSAGVSTTSRTLKTFNPSQGGGRIFMVFPGDISKYTTNDKEEAHVKQIVAQEIAKKGWQISPTLAGADYQFMYVDGLYGSESTGYTAIGNTLFEDRAYIHKGTGELFRLTPSKAMGESVWKGSCTVVRSHVLLDELRWRIGGRLILMEFPSRLVLPSQ